MFIDESSIGFAPLPSLRWFYAGRHKVAVHIAGHDPVSRVVDLAGQQELKVVLANDLSPSAAAARIARKPEDPKPSGPPSKTPMYISWGVTGALAVAAGVFAYTAYGASSDLEDLRNKYPSPRKSSRTRPPSSALPRCWLTASPPPPWSPAASRSTFTLTRPSEEKKPSKLSLGVAPTGAFVTGSF